MKFVTLFVVEVQVGVVEGDFFFTTLMAWVTSQDVFVAIIWKHPSDLMRMKSWWTERVGLLMSVQAHLQIF